MFYPADLEVRKRKDGSRIVRGRFPYNRRAVLTDGGNTGRPVKEVFKPKSFTYRIDIPTEEIHLLVGHDYDKPLASKLNGTLSFKDTAAALLIEAVITPQVLQTSYARDTLALIAAGLAVGLSPGFRIPPKRTVPNAETYEDEDPSEGRAKIRTINDALLYEMSVVTRPAYSESIVEADEDEDEEEEDEDAIPVARKRSIILPSYRWR